MLHIHVTGKINLDADSIVQSVVQGPMGISETISKGLWT